MSVWLKDSLGLEEGLQRCTDIGSLYLQLQSRFALIDTAPLQTVAMAIDCFFVFFLVLSFSNPIWQFLIENVNPHKHKLFAYWRYPVAGHRWADSNLLYSGDASREERPTDCTVIHLALIRQGRRGLEEGGRLGWLRDCSSLHKQQSSPSAWEDMNSVSSHFQPLPAHLHFGQQQDTATKKEQAQEFSWFIKCARRLVHVSVCLSVCLSSCVSINARKSRMRKIKKYSKKNWSWKQLNSAKVSSLQLHATGLGVQGHVTSSLQLKVVHYDWTGEKTEYFWQVIKKKNITTCDSKEMLNQSNCNF